METEGRINRYNPKNHTGDQPIRVLRRNVPYALENTNDYFKEITIKIIKQRGFNPRIAYLIGKDKVKTPYVNGNKQIFVQETFLSYVWCICYSLAVGYEEGMAKPSQNLFYKNAINIIDQSLVTKAASIWKYAISLIGIYSEWDKENLPNPECYSTNDEYWVERINGLYVTAMKFILCHEFVHVELAHIDKKISNSVNWKEELEFEIEADNRAMELVLDGITEKTTTTTYFGILIGLCCLLFFKNTTKGGTHPDSDERIDAILKKINPIPEDGMWGVAVAAYKLWDIQFQKMFNWPTNLSSYKELYYFIKEQVKKDKNA